ncbi:hypothetical protein IJO12_03300 [bacterium]|nr:hypothetical protein [bacterium]
MFYPGSILNGALQFVIPDLRIFARATAKLNPLAICHSGLDPESINAYYTE